MLFNSYTFLLIFLPLALLAFHGSRRLRWCGASLILLILASLIFYAYWKPEWTAILIGSILFNFLICNRVVRTAGRMSRCLLAIGICGDLALLGYFKYFNFIVANCASILGLPYTPHAIPLPLGISFFTFTQIAYLIDCFRARRDETSLVNYSLFVTIFPHLIAGPIIHHAQMRPQFEALRRQRVDHELIKMGILIFVIGLAKKVLLADNVGNGANLVFDAADHGTYPGFASAWIGVVCYTLQIYFDFSGYSDMAVGLALLFGIRLPVNFDSPYKSRSIIEFWRRWHMTLSSWLRDYLYIPLGGNRHGELARLRNVFITMLLGGLWHGAGWTFLIWGALHGLYIVANHAFVLWRSRVTRIEGALRLVLTPIVNRSLTILLVMIAWVFFRAKSLGGALLLLRSMAGYRTPSVPLSFDPALYVWIALGALIALFAVNTQQLTGYSATLTEPLKLSTRFALPGLRSGPPEAAMTLGTAVACGLLFAAAFAQLWRPVVFIYFNF